MKAEFNTTEPLIDLIASYGSDTKTRAMCIDAIHTLMLGAVENADYDLVKCYVADMELVTKTTERAYLEAYDEFYVQE